MDSLDPDEADEIPHLTGESVWTARITPGTSEVEAQAVVAGRTTVPLMLADGPGERPADARNRYPP